MTKKYITENIRTIDLDVMEYKNSNLDDFIIFFTEIKKEYPNDKIDVSFNKDELYEFDCPQYSHTLDITLNRLETDKEYDDRIKANEKAKERSKQKKQQEIEKKKLEKAANDKKEYLRLKKMFEGKP